MSVLLERLLILRFCCNLFLFHLPVLCQHTESSFSTSNKMFLMLFLRKDFLKPA